MIPVKFDSIWTNSFRVVDLKVKKSTTDPPQVMKKAHMAFG